MTPSAAHTAAWHVTVAAAACVFFGAATLLMAAIAITALGPFDGAFMAGTAVPYVIGALIVVARVRFHHPHAAFGVANMLTVARLALTSLFAGLALEIVASHIAIPFWSAWFFFAVATAALVLDGLDGFAARRQGLSSAFGSRFDMEVDALLILFLAVAAAALDKVGAWVLASGALRYFYVAASWIWPRLAGPLPPSWRRKVISVIQGGVLTALMAPIVLPPVSTFFAALALLLLVYSFAVDIRLQSKAP